LSLPAGLWLNLDNGPPARLFHTIRKTLTCSAIRAIDNRAFFSYFQP